MKSKSISKIISELLVCLSTTKPLKTNGKNSIIHFIDLRLNDFKAIGPL